MDSIGEDSDSGHPAAYRLDAVAAGEDDPRVLEHTRGCERCAAYVGALREASQAFRGRKNATDFVAAVVARARSRRRAQALAFAGPLLAAAVLVLVMRVRPTEQGAVRPSGPPVVLGSGETRFKGELSVVAIRERAGRQERMVGPLVVRASDAIRVEVSVDRAQPLTAGLLTDDGDWLPLLAPATLEPGTHFSERAARFDDKPTHATLLVGAPPAVGRARRTRQFDGLIAWRVTSEL